MELEAIGQLRDMGMMMKEARSQAQELAQHLVTDLAGCKHNPNDYVALSGGYQLLQV
ncbi:hypothetical protein V8B97DRAFT_1999905 [Scleroderma yunnanense]